MLSLPAATQKWMQVLKRIGDVLVSTGKWYRTVSMPEYDRSTPSTTGDRLVLNGDYNYAMAA